MSFNKLSKIILPFVILGVSEVYAQDAQVNKTNVKNVLMEEVIITATKRSDGQNIQDVPIAITAITSDQLEMKQIRNLEGLSYSIPNVMLDDVGVAKGVANFSIRGLGMTTTIPSIDPTVGVFVDGVYLGNTWGVVFDQFDLEGVEILRGPQGVLFGKNVTGGAVLLNTKDPSSEFEGNFKAAVETGLNTYISGSVSGPIIENKLLGKIAVYNNSDNGYFRNITTKEDEGEQDTNLIRTALTFYPNELTDLTVKYEHGEVDGDGPISQNYALFGKDSHKYASGEVGYAKGEWDFISAKFNAKIGDGVLTNIIGWRDTEHESLLDADGAPIWGYHNQIGISTEQFSEELRYNVKVNDLVDITSGLYYFEQDIDYLERRTLVGGALDLIGGGNQEQYTYGAFLSMDWSLTDQLILNTGIRYTYENKEVFITNIGGPNSATCSQSSFTCSTADFIDEENWSNVTPKIGIQWFPNPQTQLYTYYTKGFRSGGYNLRNTSPTALPGPFDDEEVNSYEAGIKVDAFDDRLRLNVAYFYNDISDMQRDVLTPDVATGATQIIQNTADATLNGIELEVLGSISEYLTFMASAGFMDAEYDKVKYDLNGDGLVNSEDKDLDIPRFMEKTYSVGFIWDQQVLDRFNLTANVNFSHRDSAAAVDNNKGYIPAVDVVDASVSIANLDGSLSLTIYGHNLTDEVIFGVNQDLPLSPLFGYSGSDTPTLTSIKKGRVIGAEVIYKF